MCARRSAGGALRGGRQALCEIMGVWGGIMIIFVSGNFIISRIKVRCQ